jgi:hypothetical protein
MSNMSIDKKVCTACFKELIGRRSHTKTCNAKCRNIEWRKTNKAPVVKLEFDKGLYDELQFIANYKGITVDRLIFDTCQEMVKDNEWLWED